MLGAPGWKKKSPLQPHPPPPPPPPRHATDLNRKKNDVCFFIEIRFLYEVEECMN